MWHHSTPSRGIIDMCDWLILLWLLYVLHDLFMSAPWLISVIAIAWYFFYYCIRNSLLALRWLIRVTWLINECAVTHFCDWYCFYYFTRNNLVAWLEVLFVRFFNLNSLCAIIFPLLFYFSLLFPWSFHAYVCVCTRLFKCPWQTLLSPLTRFLRLVFAIPVIC